MSGFIIGINKNAAQINKEQLKREEWYEKMKQAHINAKKDGRYIKAVGNLACIKAIIRRNGEALVAIQNEIKSIEDEHVSKVMDDE